MLLLDGVRRALYVRIAALAGLSVAGAAAHFRGGIGGDCSHGCRARAAAWGRADAALSGVQRFSAATARPRVAGVLRPVAATRLCRACRGLWQHLGYLGCWQWCAALFAAIFVRDSDSGSGYGSFTFPFAGPYRDWGILTGVVPIFILLLLLSFLKKDMVVKFQ